ncbi:MAG: hypothetical protein ACOH5I_16820 [Oligoflexus sp.]
MDGKPKVINLEDLHYYFDSREKDTLDYGGRSRKSREVLALRDRLLTLPDQEFEMAIKTLHQMISGEKQKDEKNENPSASELEGLYQSSDRNS